MRAGAASAESFAPVREVAARFHCGAFSSGAECYGEQAAHFPMRERSSVSFESKRRANIVHFQRSVAPQKMKEPPDVAPQTLTSGRILWKWLRPR